MKKLFLLALLGTMGLGFKTLMVQIPQDLDPLKVAADTHKLVFENPLVVVMETKLPPGKIEPMHQHRRGVVVYLTDFKVRITEKGGEPTEVQRRRGEVRWRDPVIHSVVNVGNSEGHVINVEIK